jgi:hypothetical protein
MAAYQVEACMHPSITTLVRCAVATGIIMAGLGALQAQAQPFPSGAKLAASAQQSADVLIWQGKILPIVTDIFTSINDLGTALMKNDVGSVTKVGAQFAGERIRFQQISPVPDKVKKLAALFEKSLKDMSDGSSGIAAGLRSGSKADAQRSANQFISGLDEFQHGIDQVRRSSGPAGEPTIALPVQAGPTPTPIIRGLP